MRRGSTTTYNDDDDYGDNDADDDDGGSRDETYAETTTTTIRTRLLVGRAPIGSTSRGAGYARNRAASLRDILLPDDDVYDDEDFDDDRDDNENEENDYRGGGGSSSVPIDDGGENAEKGTGGRRDRRRKSRPHSRHRYLCILDADDVMRPTRIAEQALAAMNITDENERHRTLLGCQFDRIPRDSTLHYATWANAISDERLYLERYRECTLVSGSMAEERWYGILYRWFD